MTGPEHYAKAEELLHLVDTVLGAGDYDYQAAATDLAAAQVHATLALVAFTNDVFGKSPVIA